MPKGHISNGMTGEREEGVQCRLRSRDSKGRNGGGIERIRTDNEEA